MFSVLCIYQLGIIPATMSRQWLYLFTQKLEVLLYLASSRMFINSSCTRPARPFCLLADGLTVKSFFSSRKAQIHSFRFYTKLLKTLKLMLSNAVFLFKTISSCKKKLSPSFLPNHTIYKRRQRAGGLSEQLVLPNCCRAGNR